MARKKPQNAHQRSKFERRSAQRERHQRILIVCEGEKTEPRYFNGLRNEHRLSTATIKVVPASGDPTQVLKQAQQWDVEAELDGDQFDQVWCVMDVDDHAHLGAVCQEIARTQRYHEAVSSPCFEVWLLLHFNYSARWLDADEAKRQARGLIGSYESGDTYAELASRLDDALTNAGALRQHHQSAGSGPHPNPSTDVDQLVGALRDLASSQQRR